MKEMMGLQWHQLDNVQDR